jgi:ABC-type polysaccharide/polyol phosphate transport system ATPase subunit
VSRVADRVIWLDHGKVMADGDPEEVVEQYRESVRRR